MKGQRLSVLLAIVRPELQKDLRWSEPGPGKTAVGLFISPASSLSPKPHLSLLLCPFARAWTGHVPVGPAWGTALRCRHPYTLPSPWPTAPSWNPLVSLVLVCHLFFLPGLVRMTGLPNKVKITPTSRASPQGLVVLGHLSCVPAKSESKPHSCWLQA